MERSRRKFLVNGASAVAAGVVGASIAGCKSSEGPPAEPAETKGERKAKPKAKPEPATKQAEAKIGACGLACTVCPLMKAGKCKGCASGTDATPELLKMKPCPVLKCAAGKPIDYCGNCKMFTKCKKLIGEPYDKTFMEMQAKRMGAAM